MKRRDLEQHLRAHGCERVNSVGPNDGWEHVETGRKATVPRHKEINRFTADAVCKSLGVPRCPKR